MSNTKSIRGSTIKAGFEVPGYQAFCITKAIVLHMNSKSYDYFRYNGKSKSISKNAFSKLRENLKIVYSIIEKNCDYDTEEILDYVRAYLIYESTILKLSHRKVYIHPSDLISGHFSSWYENTYKTWRYNPYEMFRSEVEQTVTKAIASRKNESIDNLSYISPKEKKKEIYNLLVHGVRNPCKNELYREFIANNPPTFSVITLIVFDIIGKLSERISKNPDAKDTPYGDLANRMQKLISLYNPIINRSKYEDIILDYCNSI